MLGAPPPPAEPALLFRVSAISAAIPATMSGAPQPSRVIEAVAAQREHDHFDRLVWLFATKFQHYESIAPSRLDPLLPGIGRDWASLLGTLANLYHQLSVYVEQFEALAARWEEERFDLLQPDTPGLHIILLYISVEQLKDVAAKEVQLLGVSSGSRSAAGSVDFMKGGAGAAGDEKEAET
jgi:hypothetical protein